MQTHTQKVAALGEVLWDMLPEGRRLGGAPTNFACHVAQFGLDACLVSAVGDDEPGHTALDELNRRGLGRYIAVVPDHPTGTVGVQLDAAGVPAYEIRRDAAWDFIPWTDALAELAAGVQAVCFGTLAQRSPVSRQTLTRFLDTMPRDGKRLRVLDVNLRPPLPADDTIVDALARCNVLKLNDEELPRVTAAVGLPPDTPPEEAARRLVADCGLRALILTCGATGSHVFTPEAESHLATPKSTWPTQWVLAIRSPPHSQPPSSAERTWPRPTGSPCARRPTSARSTAPRRPCPQTSRKPPADHPQPGRSPGNVTTRHGPVRQSIPSHRPVSCVGSRKPKPAAPSS